MTPEFDTYYLVLLKTGSNQAHLSDDETAKLQSAHLAHIRSLAEQGKLIIAGPCPNAQHDIRGVLILRTETHDEARYLVQADPAVKKGRLSVQVLPWMVEKDSLKTSITEAQS